MSTRRSLLFINIGSPLSTSVPDVSAYLKEFLTDPRIIPLPYLFRHALVKGIIAPLRARKSAKRYELIWTKDGAPLDIYTRRLAAKVSDLTGIPAYVTMRYTCGDTIKQLDQIQKDGIDKVTLIPLFPQYARSSFESSVAHVYQVYRRGAEAGRYTFSIRTIPPFYSHSGYINALVESMASHLRADAHLIFSFHGIPMDQVLPYRHSSTKDYLYHCDQTLRHILSHPSLRHMGEQFSYEMVFQSRFDSRKWLNPTLVSRLQALPSEGKKNVVVISPTFICDCLETIEEIGIMGQEIFLNNGGEDFALIPAPNDSDTMARAFADMVNDHAIHTDLSQWISRD